MVRISANGDILPDAPKSPQRSDQGGSSSSQSPQQRQQGYGSIRHDDVDNGAGAGNNGMASVFDNLNNRLLEAGIPRWNAGPYVVEPIVSLGFVLAGVVIGWHGLLFAGLLFFISKYSMNLGQGTSGGQAGRRPGPPPGRGGGGGGGGGGNRLGRL